MADNDKPLGEVDPWQSPWPETSIAQPGRDEKGLWKPGTSGNPNGRPPQSYIDKLSNLKFTSLELLTGELTLEALQDIFKHMVDKARKGDKWAIEWITKWIEPAQSTGFQGRVTPGGFEIVPIGDYRDAMRGLLSSNEDQENAEFDAG